MNNRDVIAAVIGMWEADAGMRWPGMPAPSEADYPTLYRHARAALSVESDDAFADDPKRRAVVEAMTVSIYGNAFSVVRNGRWLGTFADEETAKRYWPETSREEK